jgi:glycosyltransferase involved in cell wall biosynthesis
MVALFILYHRISTQYGGVETYLRQLLSRCIKTGIAFRAVARTLLGVQEIDSIDFPMNSRRSSSQTLWYPIKGVASVVLKGIYILLATRHVLSVGKKIQLKVAYCDDVLSSGVVCRALNLIFKVPYCIQIHGWSMQSKGYGFRRYLEFLLNRSIMRHAQLVLTTSEEYVGTLQELGVNQDCIRVVPLGVSSSRFKRDSGVRAKVRKSLNLDDEDMVLGYMGRLSPEKNVLGLVRVFELVLKNLGSKAGKVHLLIMGDGEEEDELDEYIKSRKIPNCHLLGVINKPENLYPALDLYMSMSKRETFGLSVGEALACGVPAAVSKIPAHEKLVSNNRNGVLIPKGTIQDAAKIVSDLVYNQEELSSMSIIAEESMRKWSIATSLNSVISLLKEIAAE